MATSPTFLENLLTALDDVQAQDVVVLDVRQQTSVTDYMVICTGRSSRQVKSIAMLVIEKMKTNGHKLFSITGTETGEWVLVDFGDVVIHVMQPDSRAFYNLEALWEA